MSAPIAAGLAVLLAAASACTPPADSGDVTAAAATRPSRSGNVVRFEASSPQLERIRVTPVTDAVLPVDELEIPGKIEPVPARLARLALPVPGRIRSVTVTLGDRVREGQVLATIETPDISELQSAWRQAEADVRQREAAVGKAEADVSRVRDLLTNRAIAQKDVLTAETELTAATAALEQARATRDDVARRLRLFGVNAEQSDALASVRSPIGGEVVELAVAPGEYRSDTADPIIAVADLARVWVVASVPESALARVQTGQRVSVAVAAYPNESFEGRIARVAGVLDPDTRSVRVIVELDNGRRLLKPEMFARVRYTGPARPVVTVPAGAIVQDERRTTVFVERAKGEFERREVSLGPRRNDAIVVTSGLASGDRVVVDGTMLLMAQ
jgi:cobalt-zinc-cadmium efflux system membrane fusion protein